MWNSGSCVCAQRWSARPGFTKGREALPGSEEFETSWQRFQKLGKKPMSFTDCVSLTHMDKHGMAKIMSFDSEFDGLTTRIH